MRGFLVATAFPSAFIFFLQSGEHRKILQRRSVAFDFAVGGQFLEQASHNLSAAGLGEAVREANLIRLSQCSDLRADRRDELLL